VSEIVVLPFDVCKLDVTPDVDLETSVPAPLSDPPVWVMPGLLVLIFTPNAALCGWSPD
jgi:hypothetical protein